ncbi:hypothetical protein BHE74_00030024 [Ensete ventricosum]|nr:hypothetical protein BHE74_00030024 [Ensete ventricosum]RZR99982.1 hypothetical protein BHM03_00029620 [Ensete ventricosum]
MTSSSAPRKVCRGRGRRLHPPPNSLRISAPPPVFRISPLFLFQGLPNLVFLSQSLSKIACNRLQKELVEWQVNPPAGFKHKATDNIQRWVIEATGAPGTLYANETYQLQVDFPDHYPMEAPQFRRWLADILYDSWSPAMTVSSVCISILSMLSSSTAKVELTDTSLRVTPTYPIVIVVWLTD